MGVNAAGWIRVIVPAMPDVFITTSRRIGRRRWDCRMAWRRAGFTTWCYERHSVPGLSYLNQTGQAIEQCRAFLILLSRDSLRSSQIDREIVRARDR